MSSPEIAQPAPAAPWRASRASRTTGPVLFGGSIIAMFLGMATVGLPTGAGRLTGVVAALSAAIGGLITPTLYLLASLGLGRPLAGAVLGRGGKSGSRLHVQLAMGVGGMLWLSHMMGVLGLLSEAGPLAGGARLAAWGAVGLGLAMLAHQVALGELRPERWPVFPLGLVLWAPGVALLLIAASNPPLALWESEFGGYDALSYHLQLAKEWAAGPVGRVWPVEHNVYSYLPSYMEAAFTHLGAMSLGHGAAVTRMLGEEGRWVYSCQYLHAGLAIVAAIVAARLGRVLAERAGAPRVIAAFSGIAGAALLLGTPWTTVVGSLAYNEMAMVAMGAGAMLAAADGGVGAVRRGLMVGWLTGIACSAKPTALLLVGPAVVIAMIGWQAGDAGGEGRVRRLPVLIGGAAVGGLAAIGPWLVRNALASGGNPVFPFAAGLLGRGSWTEEQVARYARAHTSGLGVGEKLWLLVSRSGVLASGGQARGLGHEQWSITPWVTLVALAIALAWKPARRPAGVVLGLGMLATLVAWGAFTHIQSRFLVPLLVPMSALFAVAASGVLVFATRRVGVSGAAAPGAETRTLPVAAAAMLGLLPLTAAGWSAINFMRQYQAQPNRLLVLGAGGLSGMLFETSLAEATPEVRTRFLSEVQPPAYVNLALRAEGDGERGRERRVYLLGDAAPLYFVEALGETAPRARHDAASIDGAARGRVGVHYHTTWDASPLGDAIASAPDDPVAWTRWMGEHGFGYVLVNYAELARLIEKDRNFDPRVTSEAVQRWVAPARPGVTGLTSIRRWTLPIDSGGRAQVVTQELFEIVGTGEARGTSGGGGK